MANLIKLKRSAVAGRAPVVGDLELGELALNTYDGKLYTKKDNGTASIVELSGGSGTLTTITNNVDNTATGYFDLPSGTTAQRPGTPNTGMIRYNSTLGCLESYVQSAWQVIANTTLDYGLITSAADTTFDYGALS